MAYRPLAGIVFAAAFLAAGTAAAQGDAALGKQVYWEGIGADGEPVMATAVGDVPVSGAQFSCVNCHKPSGFGTTEGGYYVPAITGPILFNDWTPDRIQTFRQYFKDAKAMDMRGQFRTQRGRPGYDSETLGTLLRDGESILGREVMEIMPRYDLADEDLENLTAYLKSLSAEFSPGVDDEKIHFATIFTEGVDPEARAAVQNTVETFVEWRNQAITHSRLKRYDVPYMATFEDSFRDWELHVWELEGAPETWDEQLQAYYDETPVFATVSGLVDGPWDSIGAFCDANAVPCMFPNVELPYTQDTDYGYSVHFSRGLELEAEALSLFLAEQEPSTGDVVQIHDAGPYGKTPAGAFARSFAESLPDAALTTLELAEGESLEDALAGLSGRNIDTLVVWPGHDLDGVVSALNAHGAAAERVFLPSRALETARGGLSDGLRERVMLTYPYEDPEAYHTRAFRVRAWMMTRQLEVTHSRLQNQTYYAMSLMEHGLKNLIAYFYRDYFLELVEHEAEADLNIGTHPQLALGPGQRFASKGSYLVSIDPEAQRGLRIESDWIIP